MSDEYLDYKSIKAEKIDENVIWIRENPGHDIYLTIDEAIALRYWLNKVLAAKEQ